MPVALSSFFVGLTMGGKGRGAVDLLRGDVKRTYFKYLGAAFGSAMLAAVYSLVDMAMVGQYQGPDGAAALAVVAPVWNILYSLGMLTGMGGSVLYSAYRGQGRMREANRVFTVALGTTVVIACLVWAGLVVWEVPLIRFFGGEGELIPLAQAYLYPVKFCVPLFLLNQMLAAFLRNDGRPALATGAVVAGGVFNIFGDYYLVFVADLGILGAGIATCLGAGIAVLLMATHFLSRRNTLRLVGGGPVFPTVGKIGVTGFSAFFVDIAMGILTILFNRQIMAWLGSDALAVYGVLVNVSTLVQCCGYSVGQAAQPILSQNHGARQGARILGVLRYALYTAAAFGVGWTVVLLLFPQPLITLFMVPTDQVLAIAPGILRTYGLSFLLLPFNVFSTYYFQAVLRPGSAFGVSVARGLVVSGGLILALPTLFGGQALWWAMPVTEGVVALGAAALMAHSVRRLRAGKY